MSEIIFYEIYYASFCLHTHPIYISQIFVNILEG